MSSTLSVLEEKLHDQQSYWQQKLAGELVATGIATDFKRPSQATNERNQVSIEIPAAASQRILRMCDNRNTLVLSLLQTAVTICLHKYTGAEDIVIGTSIHVDHRDLDTFNQVLPLRNAVRPDSSIKQLLGDVKNTLSEAYANQKYPFGNLLEALGIQQQANRSPLFDVSVTLENINPREYMQQLNTDVDVSFCIRDGGIAGTVNYRCELYKRDTMAVFASHCARIVESIVETPGALVRDVELMSAAARQEIITRYNDTARNYPDGGTIHALIEDRAFRSPELPAVEFRGNSMSYGELNQRANRLANYLSDLGVMRGDLVGLYLEHSQDVLVAILGVLKVGAAFVPCDPAHPLSRSEFIFDLAGISVVLTQQQLAANLPADRLQIVQLDVDVRSEGPAGETNPDAGATADDLAYVIFTSGSTGEPKGVQITHASLMNYIRWCDEVYLRGEALDFPLYSSLAFDLTITSIFAPLISGNRVVVYRRQGSESPLADVLNDKQVGVLKLTPSHLSMIVNDDNRDSGVKRLIVGGEALEVKLARRALESFGEDVEVLNEYGPTEATVGCMLHRFDPATDDRAFVPIGRPAANTRIYLLDRHGCPVAENMIGEICIAGLGLSTGYLHRDDLTAARFVDDPIQTGARMYRTGDLARWLADRNMEYIGRTDDEVKFHGYRISLNDIRYQLNEIDGVDDSVVVIVQDKHGHDLMIAYYMSQPQLDASQLRRSLGEKLIGDTLPNFMVPIDEIPLTINGKVNLAALPSLAEVRRQLVRSYTPPRTSTEQTIAEIWQSVLEIEQVGVDDHFFELGGHSLLAAKVAARLQEAFQIDLPIRNLFDTPTVSELAELLDTTRWAGLGSPPETDALSADRELGEL